MDGELRGQTKKEIGGKVEENGRIVKKNRHRGVVPGRVEHGKNPEKGKIDLPQEKRTQRKDG